MLIIIAFSSVNHYDRKIMLRNFWLKIKWSFLSSYNDINIAQDQRSVIPEKAIKIESGNSFKVNKMSPKIVGAEKSFIDLASKTFDSNNLLCLVKPQTTRNKLIE